MSQDNPIFDNATLYTSVQVKEKLNIGNTGYRSLVANGTLAFIQISARIRRFKGSTLNALCREQSKDHLS